MPASGTTTLERRRSSALDQGSVRTADAGAQNPEAQSAKLFQTYLTWRKVLADLIQEGLRQVYEHNVKNGKNARAEYLKHKVERTRAHYLLEEITEGKVRFSKDESFAYARTATLPNAKEVSYAHTQYLAARAAYIESRYGKNIKGRDIDAVYKFLDNDDAFLLNQVRNTFSEEGFGKWRRIQNGLDRLKTIIQRHPKWATGLKWTMRIGLPVLGAIATGGFSIPVSVAALLFSVGGNTAIHYGAKAYYSPKKELARLEKSGSVSALEKAHSLKRDRDAKARKAGFRGSLALIALGLFTGYYLRTDPDAQAFLAPSEHYTQMAWDNTHFINSAEAATSIGPDGFFHPDVLGHHPAFHTLQEATSPAGIKTIIERTGNLMNWSEAHRAAAAAAIAAQANHASIDLPHGFKVHSMMYDNGIQGQTVMPDGTKAIAVTYTWMAADGMHTETDYLPVGQVEDKFGPCFNYSTGDDIPPPVHPPAPHLCPPLPPHNEADISLTNPDAQASQTWHPAGMIINGQPLHWVKGQLAVITLHDIDPTDPNYSAKISELVREFFEKTPGYKPNMVAVRVVGHDHPTGLIAELENYMGLSTVDPGCGEITKEVGCAGRDGIFHTNWTDDHGILHKDGLLVGNSPNVNDQTPVTPEMFDKMYAPLEPFVKIDLDSINTSN